VRVLWLLRGRDHAPSGANWSKPLETTCLQIALHDQSPSVVNGDSERKIGHVEREMGRPSIRTTQTQLHDLQTQRQRHRQRHRHIHIHMERNSPPPPMPIPVPVLAVLRVPALPLPLPTPPLCPPLHDIPTRFVYCSHLRLAADLTLDKNLFFLPYPNWSRTCLDVFPSSSGVRESLAPFVAEDISGQRLCAPVLRI